MKSGMTAVDTAVVILIFGITAVLAIAFVKYYIEIGNVPVFGANRSPIARLVRYMACAIAACNGGCDSGYTYSIPLEYGKGSEPTLGCNQLLHELSYCTGANAGKKLCGKDYALNFIFEDETTYTGNYYVTWDNPGPCSVIQTGWQTDASCLRYFRPIMDCACFKCEPYPGTPVIEPGWWTYGLWGQEIYEGRLFLQTECKIGGRGGVIYLDPSLGKNCIPIKTGEPEQASCKFEKDAKIKIWSDNAYTNYNYCAFNGCLGPPIGWCGGLEGLGCGCPSVMLYDSSVEC